MPCVSFGELISDCHHPGGCQLSRIPGRLVSNWEPTHSLVEDAISGAKIASHLLALAAAHLPLCLQWGKGLIRIWLALLWCLLNPLFCEQARLLWESSLSLFFSFFLWLSHFGLLSHLSSLRLFSGHSGLVLTLRTDDAACAFLPSPNLLVANRSTWATSLLAVAISCIFCEFFSFFSPVMFPWGIPKLATGIPVRGFPTVWRLLLLPDSLPRMDLHP